jgi:enamine deaminase RidA (YjgF/YER057c/UK114 family)
MVATFGEAGSHVRISVDVAALPKAVPVEVEATIELLDVPPCVPATW